LSSIGKQFVNALPSSVTQDSKDTFQPTTFNGQPALKFTQGRYTIDVASSGPPYVLYLADSATGSLTFSQWNSVPTITPPPAADVISL
ncbi:MAG: hypothetical protein J2P29_08775, partial [Actinobacteria bacterium]|nr:hypothetical protein [Actinomycetota bacterium]